MSVITVDYMHETVSMARLAHLTGIKRATLQRRYLIGDRGECLWRPLDPATRLGLSQQQYDMVDGKRIEASRREQDRQRQAAVTERRRLSSERLVEARRQHAEAFARPLIAADLLTKLERAEIRENVTGRQRWWTADSAYVVT